MKVFSVVRVHVFVLLLIYYRGMLLLGLSSTHTLYDMVQNSTNLSVCKTALITHNVRLCSELRNDWFVDFALW